MRDIRPVPNKDSANADLPPIARLPLPATPAPKGLSKPSTSDIAATPKRLPATTGRLPGAKVPVTAVTPIPSEKKLRPSAKTTPSASGPQAPSRPRMRLGHRERLVVVGLLSLVVVAGLLATLIFLPKARLQLVLRTSPLLIDEKLTIKANAAASDTIIPGSAFFREVEVQGSSPVTSTEVIGQKAHGSVNIINRTVTEQKIKERSRLVTKDGTLFYMVRSATIPAAADNSPRSVSVEVEADQPGEAGNIAAQRLNFAALDASSQTLVYAEAPALSGGTGETIKVVKAVDLEAARAAAGTTARAQVEQQIRAELPHDWAILEESWTTELGSFETAVAENSREQAIPYKARVVVRVMGYEQAALESRLKTVLEQKLDTDYELFPGPISYTKTIENVNWEQAEATVAVRVTHTTIAKISLDTLRQKLAGRSEAEAQKYVEGLPGVRAVKVDLWPFWATSIPRIEKRIVIDVQPERQP